MVRASGAIGASPRRVSPPRGFTWDFAAHPLSVFDSGKRYYKTDIRPRSKVTQGIWSGPQYWVAHDGSDDNTGTSRTAPLASAWKARDLAERDPAAAQGYSINVVPDPAVGLLFLDASADFNDTANLGGASAGRTTDRPFALTCHGGKLIMGPCQLLPYTAADTATNTWTSTSDAGVAAIYNISEYGSFGVTSRIPKLTAGVVDDASALAAIQAAPGDAWAQAEGSSNFYVRLANGEEVSNTSISVASAAYGLRLGTGDVYVSGVELIGGCLGAGAIDAGAMADRSLVFEDVGAWGAGRMNGPATPAIGLDNMTGLAIFNRCYGYDALGDIFSFRGSSGQLHALMIDCWGMDAGHSGAQPISYGNHIVSTHDSVRLISLNTQASYSAGGCVRGTGNSQHWDLGSIYAFDRGDFWLGTEGSTPPTGVQVDDDARYWGQDITVAGCETSFSANANAQLLLRSPVEMGGRRGNPTSIGDY